MQWYSFFILSNTLQFSTSIRLHSDCNMTMFCRQILTPLIHHHRYFTRTLKHLVVYEGLDVASLPSSGLSNLLRLLQHVTSLESIEFHGRKCPQQQQQHNQQGHSREPLQFFKLLKRLPLRRLVIEDCGYYEDVDYFELEQDDSVFKNTIEELSVMHSRSYEITRSISSFKNLRFLVLHGDYGQTSVENVRFAAAGALSKLESLDIGSKELDLFRKSPILLPKLRTFKAGSSVGSSFLEFLPQLDRLECSFDTHCVDFDDFNRGLRYLNHIDASYWTIIDEDKSEDCVCEDVWEKISSSFLDLTELHLGGFQGKIPLSMIPSLRQLHLTMYLGDNDDLYNSVCVDDEEGENVHGLEVLSIDCPTDRMLDYYSGSLDIDDTLASLKSLTSLELHCCAVGPLFFSSIECLTQLKMLDLSYVRIECRDWMPALSQLSSLRWLKIDSRNFLRENHDPAILAYVEELIVLNIRLDDPRNRIQTIFPLRADLITDLLPITTKISSSFPYLESLTLDIRCCPPLHDGSGVEPLSQLSRLDYLKITLSPHHFNGLDSPFISPYHKCEQYRTSVQRHLPSVANIIVHDQAGLF